MKLRPIVILISSDPELVIEDEQLAKTNDGIFFDEINLDRIITDPPGRLGANETLGPVKGLLSPRTARGILAAKELRQWINRCKAERRFCGGADYIAEPAFFHFRMQTKNADEVPALGWLLSEQAESRIWNMLGCVDHNRRELETLLRLFGTSEQRISRALGNCS
jgi:hypothetical protein